MADFRPFSTPSPLLIFPSASPSSKLRCTPTRKPPTPIDWTEECYQDMLLETDQHHPRCTGEQKKSSQYTMNNIAPIITMDSTLRRHSTPDFMALYHYEALPPVSTESPIDTNLIPCVTNIELKSTKMQSFTPSAPSVSKTSSSDSFLNLSIISSSTSSMSYISSISNSDEDASDPGVSVILKPRHVSMIHEQKRSISHDINLTGTSWQSTSAQSISTTLREYQYQERFAKKKSKFSLLVAKMKRAAERPFKMMDGPNEKKKKKKKNLK